MKNIINYIIKAIIIIAAAYLFPEYVVCADTRSLVLALVCMAITGIVIGVIALGVVVLLACKGKEWTLLIFAVITGLLSGILQLFFSTYFVSGFSINGVGTFIILAIFMSLFSISSSSSKNK